MSSTAAALAAAQRELAQLQQELQRSSSAQTALGLTQSPEGQRWAAAASQDMARRAAASPSGGGGARASRHAALSAELEAARRELTDLSAVVQPGAGGWQPATQIPASEVRSAQRVSFTPGRTLEYEPSSSLHRHNDRSQALADARAELARLQGMAAAAAPPPRPPPAKPERESLAALRAELEYLEGLSRRPTSYTLPPGDAELLLQILRFYDYTSGASEPQMFDFYDRSATWKPRLFTPPPSPGVRQKASELSVLRQQLAELQQPHAFSQHQHDDLTAMRSPSTPAAYGESPSAIGLDYTAVSFGYGSSALKTPAPPLPTGLLHDGGGVAATQPVSGGGGGGRRTSMLEQELAAAKAELAALP